MAVYLKTAQMRFKDQDGQYRDVVDILTSTNLESYKNQVRTFIETLVNDYSLIEADESLIGILAPSWNPTYYHYLNEFVYALSSGQNGDYGIYKVIKEFEGDSQTDLNTRISNGQIVKTTIGNELNLLKNAIVETRKSLFQQIVDMNLWESGAWKAADGSASSTAYYIRTKTFLSNDIVGINIKEGYKVACLGFTESGDYIGNWSATKNNEGKNFVASSGLRYTTGPATIYFNELNPNYKYKLTITTAPTAGTTTLDMPTHTLLVNTVERLRQNIILIQDTQPTSDFNRIWLPTQGQFNEVTVPTYDEFNQLSEVIKNGKLNQHIKTNPFAVGSSSELGALIELRSKLTIRSDGSVKSERAGSNSLTTYGFYIKLENNDNINLTGHKILFRLSGVDVSGATHFSELRFFGSMGSTASGDILRNLTDLTENMDFILTPNANINTLSVLLVPGSTPSAGEYFTINSMQWIDLTAMFGSGYEPSIDEFLHIYGSDMPYSYIQPSLEISFKETKTWLEMATQTAFRGKTEIMSSTDLDTLTDTGFYLLYSGYTYTNTPPFYTRSGGAAWLFTFETVTQSNFTFRVQLFVKASTGVWAFRRYTTSVGTGYWSPWITYNNAYNALNGKKVSIIGDSISTYKNWNPTDYAYYYPVGNVDSVDETWWKRIIDASNMTLVSNASWSGSQVCDRDSDPVNNAKVAYSDARINDLSNNGTIPDIIIILIGTNDFNYGSDIGTFTETSEIPDGQTSISTFKAAYACMVNKCRNTYPHAHIYCCTLIQRYRGDDDTYPILNGNGIALSQYNKAIIDVAEWLNCNIIPFDKCFSLAELSDYMVDGKLHPNSNGMAILANKALQYLMLNEQNYI